jgi:hypothetical protein
MESFFIITDYNHLPQDLSQSWIPKYAKNFLIYDRANRWEENDNIKKQINVGENIYDMFDFIVNNYENLPDIMIFVKADVIPRHCGEDKFKEIIKNKIFTPIENYCRTVSAYTPGAYAYVDENGGYMESSNEVNYVLTIHPCKYLSSYQHFLNEIYENPTVGNYIRFAPGGNYLITKSDVLRYNKSFYETLRMLVSWDIRPGEAFILERAIFTIFNNNFIIKEKFKY